ncbi:MAG: four helix bundle protein [Alistipes sp.]|nr:four helix bundle protein [Alistipes sp.]
MAAEYDHLPVYKAAYDLLQHVYRDKCIASVPRDVKYTLVERLKQDILEVLVLIYKAHYNMLGDKALQLQQARELIPGVKARMRIMYDLRYINLELFRTLAVEVESVSKQLGAWHTKTLRRRIVAPPAPARTAASAPAAAAATPAAAPVAAQTAAPVAASVSADPFAAPAPAATRPASVAASVPADPFAVPAPAAIRPAPAPRSARTDLFAAPAPAAAAPFPAPDPLASPAPEAPWAAPGEDNE